MKLLVYLLGVVLAFPQIPFPGPGRAPAGGGGGGGPIALIDSDKDQAAGETDPATTPSMNCTGANFVVVVAKTAITAADAITVTSSPPNTFTALTVATSGSYHTAIWYVANASVSGAMTVTGTGGYAYIDAACFSNVKTSSPFDQQNGGSCVGPTCQSGSITPTENDELVVAGLVNSSSSVTGNSINESYTTMSELPLLAGQAAGGGAAFKIQSTAAATNPTWSPNDQGSLAAAIASFKKQP